MKHLRYLTFKCKLGISDLISYKHVPGCFKLTSCDQNMTNQNIHAYGIMLIVSGYLFIFVRLHVVKRLDKLKNKDGLNQVYGSIVFKIKCAIINFLSFCFGRKL